MKYTFVLLFNKNSCAHKAIVFQCRKWCCLGDKRVRYREIILLSILASTYCGNTCHLICTKSNWKLLLRRTIIKKGITLITCWKSVLIDFIFIDGNRAINIIYVDYCIATILKGHAESWSIRWSQFWTKSIYSVNWITKFNNFLVVLIQLRNVPKNCITFTISV